jgi:hypothetical protein
VRQAFDLNPWAARPPAAGAQTRQLPLDFLSALPYEARLN